MATSPCVPPMVAVFTVYPFRRYSPTASVKARLISLYFIRNHPFFVWLICLVVGIFYHI